MRLTEIFEHDEANSAFMRFLSNAIGVDLTDEWIDEDEREYAESIASEHHMNIYSKPTPPGGEASLYIWTPVEEYPIARLSRQMSPAGLGADPVTWINDEIEERLGGDYSDRAEEWQEMMNGFIREPVVIVEVNGKAYMWDGYHRTAITIAKRGTTIKSHRWNT